MSSGPYKKEPDDTLDRQPTLLRSMLLAETLTSAGMAPAL